jgi:sulfhydrogenase subunit alpha
MPGLKSFAGKASRMKSKSRTIKVDYLARVEGEGALYIKIRGEDVLDVKLRIFEPPRFFEAFLRGRGFQEAPDITARICGICPIAYQMSAVHAVENAFGISVTGPLRDLRRLIYCGEWIESHSLHIYLLHAPDFLGYEDAIRMGKDHREALERGLALKSVGNELISFLGGRSIHPINVCVGGFYSVPTRRQLEPLAERLKRARDQALETVQWVSKFTFPAFEQEYEFVSLSHSEEYPFNEGRIVSSAGLNTDAQHFDDWFIEEQVPHSTALQCRIQGRGAYFVGPMARYNLNRGKLSPIALDAAASAGLGETCRNPFQSVIVRAVEVLYACDEALRIIDRYEPPDRPAVAIEPRAGTGRACTEAPRGMLYHRYKLGDSGNILDAKIVPPTSQNQRRIETDLYSFVKLYTALPNDKLTLLCEQAVRNYDPCISCSTHFLKVDIDR